MSNRRRHTKFQISGNTSINMKRISFLLIAFLSSYAFAEDESSRPLDGTKVMAIKCDTPEKLAVLEPYRNNKDFDFVGEIANDVFVLVTADSFDGFESVLSKNGIAYKIVIEDIQEEIQDDHDRNQVAKIKWAKKNNITGTHFTYYPRYANIERYLKEISRTYRNITSLVKIGSSYKGRAIWALKISSGGGGDDKPAVLIDAGIHAREWIAPTTALYAIHQLVVNETNRQLYENTDWYIIPNLNPDGYEFSHTSNRLWRKSRSPNAASLCYGTDLNRNFGFEWMTVGGSSNPCDGTYVGNVAFSEQESKTLRDFVLSRRKSIKAYLSLHSHGQFMLMPWGYTNASPADEPELRSVAVAAEKALSAVRGTRYTIGSPARILYPASGGSLDWVKAVGGVPLSYTLELPGGGKLGFNPPPSAIEPVGAETFEAFKVFGKYVATKYGK